LLNHPEFDKSTVLEESQNFEEGVIGEMIQLFATDDCVIEVLSHPTFENYSLNGALYTACTTDRGKILKWLLEDDRVNLTIEYCQKCLLEFYVKYSFRKKVKVGFAFCKQLQVYPNEITSNEHLIESINQLLNTTKSKSARK